MWNSGAGRFVCAVAAGGAVFFGGSHLDPQAPGPEDYRGAIPVDGLIEASTGYTPARMERLIARRDELVRGCTAELGVHWTPAVSDPHEVLSPRGLFGIETPAAVDAFLISHGYGVADTVRVLEQSSTAFAQAPEATRSGSERAVQACHARAAARTGGVDLRSGGDLGRAYDRAMSAMRVTPEYDAIASDVLSCMQAAGVGIASLELAAEPFIRRLVDLVGGSVELDSNGRLTYEIGGARPKQFQASALRAIRTAELAAARVELRCRRENRVRATKLWAAFSAPVLRAHARQIRALRIALSHDS